MRIAIARALLDSIVGHAADEHPREGCGLLFGTSDRIERVEPTTNVAERREDSFEIDPTALIRAQRAARSGGPAVVGWYHSHPNGRAEPSERDVARIEEDGRLWLIVAGREVGAFLARRAGDRRSFERCELAVE